MNPTLLVIANIRRSSSRLVPVVVPLLLAASALAAAGTQQVCSKGDAIGEPTAADRGWAKGVLDILNDPLRGDGWNPWFTELPNDVEYFKLHARTMDDVNRLIAKLSKIEGAQIRISPESEVRIGWTAARPRGPDPALVLAIGSETVRAKWRKYLEKSEKASDHKRQLMSFGGGKALPATLIVYAGNPIIDLEKLKVPNSLPMTSEKSARNAGVKAVEEWVKKHNDAVSKTEQEGR